MEETQMTALAQVRNFATHRAYELIKGMAMAQGASEDELDGNPEFRLLVHDAMIELSNPKIHVHPMFYPAYMN